MKVKRSYCSYLYHSKGRHGVHSPFVFEIMDKCLTTKMDKNFSLALKRWTQVLKSSTNLISVTDYGAGSRLQMGQKRKIKAIFQQASTKGIYGTFLYKLVSYYQPRHVLELGTSLGSGSFHICGALMNGTLTTVEGCSETQQVAINYFPKEWKNKVRFENKLFKEFFQNLDVSIKYDLVYIDGHHNAEATAGYLTDIYPHLHSNSLVIIDDIRWSSDMWQGWNEWIKDNRFHVAMDFGRWGILVPRKGQTKEFFVLRPFVFKTPWF